MANVNEQAYGSKDLWYSIPYGSTQFPSSTAIEERNTLANFTDTIPSSIDWHLYLGRVIYEVEVNNNQTLRDLFYNTVFDRSICFVGQSGKSSYTSIRFFDNQGTNSNNPDVHELPTQTYDVVNLAFNYGLDSMRDYGNGVRRWDVIGADIDKDPSGNALKFDAIRWCPSGWSGIKGTDYYYTDYGNRYKTTFVTNMGTKRNVLVPYIKAGPTDTSDTNAIQTYDLATYLSTYKDSNPYVYSIGFEVYVMYGDSIEASSSNRRTGDFDYGIMLMEYISSLNDFYYIGPDNAWQTAHYNNDLFVPQTLKSPHMPLGGYINNGSYSGDIPSALGYESTLNSVGVHAVIDCNVIKWDTWVNIGSSTAEGTCNKILVADARKYTKDEFREAVRSSLACFGMFFTDDIEVASSGKLDDPQMHLGTIVNGIGYGDYTSSSANREQPQWNWDSMGENDYDPENPPSPVMPDNWSDTTNPPYSINKTPLPNKWYTCPPAAIPNIMNAVNSIDLENLDKSNTFGLNPIDGIIAIRKMFFNQPIAESFLTGDIVGAITIGVIQVQPDGGTANAIIRHESNAPYTYISVTGYPVGEKAELRDFRSYFPYTSCMFYDAFCGSIEIDPAKILNKYITITQTVDFLNGDKITSLYASEIPSNIGERIAMLLGKCCEDVPLNGNKTADYLRNKYILSQEYKQSQGHAVSRAAMGAGGASISAISGNVIGTATQAVGTIANTMTAGTSSETIETQMTHLVPSVSKINAGTSNVESGIVSGPTLFLYLPKMNENYNELLYGNLTGFAGYKVVKPKDLRAGTHIFSHPKVSISGTKNEAYMLVDQLQKGIIIK